MANGLGCSKRRPTDAVGVERRPHAWSPSGSLRVRVYAGIDLVTSNRQDLWMKSF
jgi:hypothetical protein